MQISIQRDLPVVIVNLSPIEGCLTDRQIEQVRAIAVALAAAFENGQVRDTVIVDKNPDDRPVDTEAVKIPSSMQYRYHPHARLCMIDLKQRRIRIWSGPIN